MLTLLPCTRFSTNAAPALMLPLASPPFCCLTLPLPNTAAARHSISPTQLHAVLSAQHCCCLTLPLHSPPLYNALLPNAGAAQCSRCSRCRMFLLPDTTAAKHSCCITLPLPNPLLPKAGVCSYTEMSVCPLEAVRTVRCPYVPNVPSWKPFVQ